MQGQPAVVDADAVCNGVTSDTEFFDRFSLETAGIGTRHNPATCTDVWCARCGKSTAGPNLDGNLRAGDVTPDLGHPAYESRTYHPLNEYIEEQTPEQLVTGPQYREKPGPILLGDSVKNLMRASTEPDRRGGGSNGRKRTDGCSPDFGVTQNQLIRDNLRYV